MSIREAVIRHAELCREAPTAGKPRPRWEGGSLSGAHLSGANLTGADLDGADLRSAYLSSANLYGADLTGADLSSADLDGANLGSADLSGANLRGANLGGTNLGGTNLGGANGIVSVGPVGTVGRTIYGVAGLNGAAPMFQAGCFWGTESELRAAITARYADGSGIERHRASYLAAVDFIVAALAAQEAT